MARPSQNLDLKLIELGKEKIITHGVSNLSIRQICLDAKINLGMFYYYFKSKENFIKSLFKSLNDDLTSSWLAEVEKLLTSEQKIKRVLLMTTKMMREKHGIIETIMKDTNIFDKMYIDIGKAFHKQWINFFAGLVNECKNDGYLDKNIDTKMLIAIITGAVHGYAKNCETCDNEEYYSHNQHMIDFILEKFK